MAKIFHIKLRQSLCRIWPSKMSAFRIPSYMSDRIKHIKMDLFSQNTNNPIYVACGAFLEFLSHLRDILDIAYFQFTLNSMRQIAHLLPNYFNFRIHYVFSFHMPPSQSILHTSSSVFRLPFPFLLPLSRLQISICASNTVAETKCCNQWSKAVVRLVIGHPLKSGGGPSNFQWFLMERF